MRDPRNYDPLKDEHAKANTGERHTYGDKVARHPRNYQELKDEHFLGSGRQETAGEKGVRDSQDKERINVGQRQEAIAGKQVPEKVASKDNPATAEPLKFYEKLDVRYNELEKELLARYENKEISSLELVRKQRLLDSQKLNDMRSHEEAESQAGRRDGNELKDAAQSRRNRIAAKQNGAVTETKYMNEPTRPDFNHDGRD